MKHTSKLLYCGLALILLAGCTSNKVNVNKVSDEEGLGFETNTVNIVEVLDLKSN